MNNLSEINQRYLTEVLTELVRIDSRSTAHGGCEGAVQRRVAEHLRDADARVRVIDTDCVAGFRTHPLCHGPHRQYADRPTVIAELGPADAPALLVVAHCDTVPLLEPEAWTVDPFGGVVDGDGRIYGLGVSDDKWGLASIIAIARALRGRPLRKRLILASSIDEENGVGNGMLLLVLAGVRAEAALYLDGYGMEINRGCLGGSNLYLRPIGSIPDALRDERFNQLAIASRRLSEQRRLLFDRDGFDDNVIREISVQAMRRADDGGAIRLPFYTLPGESREQVQALLERAVADALGADMSKYDMSYREPWFEPALLNVDFPLIGCVARAARRVLGRDARVTTISKQDSFVLTNHANIPTVSFGCTARSAGRGAYHCPDEYLTADELRDGANVACLAVREWLGEGT